jgi:hypothetical protein
VKKRAPSFTLQWKVTWADLELSACGQNVASSAMDYPTEADQRPQRIGRERIISNRKAAERGCKQWLAGRQFCGIAFAAVVGGFAEI